MKLFKKLLIFLFFLAAGINASINAQSLYEWSALGSQANGYGVNGEVNTIVIYNGNVIAGGTFTTAGNTPVSNIASYNGSNWLALGQGINGSFLMYDLNKNVYAGYNIERTKTRFTPASTFKIFNSLAALEAGVMSDENQIIKWDSVQRQVKEWNQDLDMKSAFKYSAVWFYQEIARKIGQDRM